MNNETQPKKTALSICDQRRINHLEHELERVSRSLELHQHLFEVFVAAVYKEQKRNRELFGLMADMAKRLKVGGDGKIIPTRR